MRFRLVVVMLCAAVAAGGLAPAALARQQQGGNRSGQAAGTPVQRLDILRSRLDTMRRTLNGAIAGLNARDAGTENAADDPRARLRGLEKEVNSLYSDVTDLRGRVERADKYDTADIEKLEAGVNDLSDRVDAGMRATAGARSATNAPASANNNRQRDKKKGGGGFLGLGKIFGGGGDEKYAELVGTVAVGRDRELFEIATKEARNDNYEVARSLYSVIINTYPESAYLPLAKLAIADTFYLEGTTSALIQAAQSYQDWLTFFPTDPLSDEVMLKIAEVEMRKMGLPDRDVSSARKAEQRIKVLLQQFPDTALKPDAEVRLREVQEVLAAHDMFVGDQYYSRYFRGVANSPKGAQSRYLDIVRKYPNFSYMDEVLLKLAETYIQEEEPDEATKYLQQLVRYHPNSRQAEKAKEKLMAIGASVPEPDAEALRRPTPERPGTMQTVMIQLRGHTYRTIDKNGILISSDDKARDLIQQANENGGQLPHSQAAAPAPRVAPARQQQPAPQT
ncbi:MAG TPA: outer membrane protein assembly factor BamD, partial [Pyrinomonadaceae bacterium]|nr:outer membrane protein assembly factor BamD [Pyrinomonadaceae bacterium]